MAKLDLFWPAGQNCGVFKYATNNNTLTCLRLPEGTVGVVPIAGAQTMTIVGSSTSKTALTTTTTDAATDSGAVLPTACTVADSLDTLTTGQKSTICYAAGGADYFLLKTAAADTICLVCYRAGT